MKQCFPSMTIRFPHCCVYRSRLQAQQHPSMSVALCSGRGLGETASESPPVDDESCRSAPPASPRHNVLVLCGKWASITSALGASVGCSSGKVSPIIARNVGCRSLFTPMKLRRVCEPGTVVGTYPMQVEKIVCTRMMSDAITNTILVMWVA